MGFNEVPCFAAWERTAPSVRPSFKPITRVGVFCLAKVRNCCLALADHDLPLLRVDFAMGSLLRLHQARVSAPDLRITRRSDMRG